MAPNTKNHEPQQASNNASNSTRDLLLKNLADPKRQILYVNGTNTTEPLRIFPILCGNETKIHEEDAETEPRMVASDLKEGVLGSIFDLQSTSDAGKESTPMEAVTGTQRSTSEGNTTPIRKDETSEDTFGGNFRSSKRQTLMVDGTPSQETVLISPKLDTMTEVSENQHPSSRQNGMAVENEVFDQQMMSGDQADEDIFRPVLQPMETMMPESSRRKRATQMIETSVSVGEYSPKSKPDNTHTVSNARETVTNPNLPSPQEQNIYPNHHTVVKQRKSDAEVDGNIETHFNTKPDPNQIESHLVRSPHLFTIPVQRDSYFHSEYFRESRTAKANDKDSKKITKRGMGPNENNKIFGKHLDVEPRPKITSDSDKTLYRGKRGVSVSRLLVDPTVKLDVPKTIQNLGAATKNAFEDQRKPLYHVRNLLGSTKNAFMSAMSIPPQNFIVPSNYKIDKIEDEDSVAKVLNPSEEQVGAINTDLLSRMKQIRSRSRVSEDVGQDAKEDPFQIMDTFHRIGAVLRESVKSGQDTLKHIGDVAQDTRNIFYTARHSAPRIELPYTRVNPLRSKPRVRSKAVVYTPHILDIERARGIERNPLDSRPDFVRLGEIMDAVGVSKSKSSDLDEDKITLEAIDKPTPRLKASLSTYRPKKIKATDMKTMLQDIRALNEAKKKAGAKTLKEFIDNLKSRIGNTDKELPRKKNFLSSEDNSREATIKRFDSNLKDQDFGSSRGSETYTKVFGTKNNEEEEDPLDQFVEELLTTPVDSEKRAKEDSEEIAEDQEIDAFLDDLVSSSHATKESAKQRLKSNIQKIYKRKLSRLENANTATAGSSLPDKSIKSGRDFLEARIAEQKVDDHENSINEIPKEKKIIKGGAEDHILKKRSAEDPVIEPVFITTLKHHEARQNGKKTPRLVIRNIEEKERFPESEELVGASLMVDPQMLKPFMERASEDEVQKFINEIDARYSSDKRHTPADLKEGQLDHVLGAINPLMFEELFNRTLNTGEEKQNGDTWDDTNNDEEVLGVMQMTGRVLQPFMGMVPDDTVTDFLDYYNPQEFDFTSAREGINDRAADYE